MYIPFISPSQTLFDDNTFFGYCMHAFHQMYTLRSRWANEMGTARKLAAIAAAGRLIHNNLIYSTPTHAALFVYELPDTTSLQCSDRLENLFDDMMRLQKR